MDDSKQPVAPKRVAGASSAPDTVTPIGGALSRSRQESSAKITQAPTEGPSHPCGKSKKKVALVILALVIGLTLVGGIVYLVLMSNMSSGNANEEVITQPSQGENNNDKDSSGEPASKDDSVALSLDDELVQRLYKQFDFTLSQFIWTELFGDVGDETKLRFAIAANSSTTICKDRYGLFYGEGEYNPETFSEPWSVRGEGCVNGSLVRDAIETVFGSEIALENKQIIDIHCNVFLYDASNDEFIDLNTGCTGPSSVLIRGLYAAEKSQTHLYLYEVVTYRTPLALVDGGLNDDGSGSGYAYYILGNDGNRTDEYFLMDEDITSENVANYKETFTKFKWTFVWNGENYVFEKLEQI